MSGGVGLSPLPVAPSPLGPAAPQGIQPRAERFVQQVQQANLPVRPVSDVDLIARHQYVSLPSGQVSFADEPQRPDLNQETVAYVESPDREHFFRDHYGIQLDHEQMLTSWSQFPAVLAMLRTQQVADPQHRHITLGMEVHGNHGTGFMLKNPADHSVSVASAAWINAQLQAAGFQPGDVTIVSEACNSGHGYETTVDGMDETEVGAVMTNLQQSGLHLREPIFDVAPGAQPAADFPWIGRASGVNPAGTVFLQYASGMIAPGQASDAAPGTQPSGHPTALVGVQATERSRVSLLNGVRGTHVQASDVRASRGWAYQGTLRNAIVAATPRLDATPGQPLPDPILSRADRLSAEMGSAPARVAPSFVRRVAMRPQNNNQ